MKASVSQALMETPAWDDAQVRWRGGRLQLPPGKAAVSDTP